VDYITSTFGITDDSVRDALQKKNGKVMDAIKSLGDNLG
jgi:NACalpha-BTF3-like transcription factor